MFVIQLFLFQLFVFVGTAPGTWTADGKVEPESTRELRRAKTLTYYHDHRGMLYRKVIWRTTRSPLNSVGKGGKGVDALIAATAASLSALPPDSVENTILSTLPCFEIANARITSPRCPRRAASG